MGEAWTLHPSAGCSALGEVMLAAGVTVTAIVRLWEGDSLLHSRGDPWEPPRLRLHPHHLWLRGCCVLWDLNHLLQGFKPA